MVARPRRSVLYMPGSNAKALAKARDAGGRRADPRPRRFGRPRRQSRGARTGRRGGARRRFWRARSRHPHQRACIRPGATKISPPRSPPSRTPFCCPRSTDPGAIMVAARALREADAPERTRIWAMMETPNAILNAGSIAAIAADSDLAPRGLGDGPQRSRQGDARAADARAPRDDRMDRQLRRRPRAPTASTSSTASTTTSRDLDGFRAECEQGRDMGLDGKTLIHPGQIDICNEVFAPDRGEVERARAIIAAFALPENAGKGVIQLNGRMVELLHAEMARRTLAISRRDRQARGGVTLHAALLMTMSSVRPSAANASTSESSRDWSAQVEQAVDVRQRDAEAAGEFGLADRVRRALHGGARSSLRTEPGASQNRRPAQQAAECLRAPPFVR